MGNYQPKSNRLTLRSWAELYEKLSPTGLLPPQCVDLEEALLGACMIDKSSANRAFSIIGPRNADTTPFYHNNNSFIWFAMTALAERGEPIDLMTVKNQLSLDGKLEAVGGPAYLVELTSKVVTTVNVESYSRIVLEKYVAREIIRICEESKLRAFEGELDALTLLDEMQGHLVDVGTIRGRKGIRHATQAYDELWRYMQTPPENGIRGIPTGIHDFDEMMGGIRLSEQTLLGALTSRGKTALAIQIARENLDRGGWVAVFSLETGAAKLLIRVLAAELGIENTALDRGELSSAQWLDVKEAMKRLKHLPLYIDDSGSRTPFDIRTELRRIAGKQKGPGLVIVDYLQLVDGQGRFDSREREVTTVSRQLRALWKDFEVAGLPLIQFNRRAGDDRDLDMRDLRESGALEQDTRAAIFINYPYRKDAVVIPRVETVSLALVKNDGGPLGKVECDFHKHLCRFTEHGWMEDSVGRRRREPTVGTTEYTTQEGDAF